MPLSRSTYTLARPRSGSALLLLGLCSLAAQACSSVSAQTIVGSAAQQTHTVQGQVVNALDGAPVPRALVTVNTRSVLTDYQGRFVFANFIGASAFASVRKPGFSAGADASTQNSAQRLTDLDAPILVKLYPEAIVAGILTGRDGAPLSHVQVRLLRSQYDGVALRWVPAGSAQTSARGEYRIPTSAGRLRVLSAFVRQSSETGEAILPASFPEPSQSTPSTLLEVHSGEERRLDLRARVGPLYPVNVRVEPTNAQRMNLRVAVSTSAGDEFYANVSSDQRLDLPVGTYSLRVQVDTREDSMSGTSRVTVTGQDTPTAVVHLAPDTPIAVELLAGTLAASPNSSSSYNLAQLPNVQQFNLSLHNELATGETSDQDVRMRPAPDKNSTFHVPPGRYRLTASGGGPWHIQSAVFGSTDLLLNDLVIASGSAGGTLRILVSNETGTVHARTNLPQGASGWMYLVPRGPSLAPINPIGLSVDGTGASIATASVPAGAYTAVLMDAHLQEDPRDPAFLASFASGPIDIEVQPGGDASFNLDLAHRKVSKP